MSQVTTANLVGAFGALLALAGVSGVTSVDVQGFTIVLGALVSVVAHIWSALAHKSATSTS
jgi:hypothetical protein